MADIDITVVTDIEGLDELETALHFGSARAAKKFLRRAEMKAAKPLVDALQAAAPFHTGRLTLDIRRESKVDVANGTLTVRVGPSKNTFYGWIQEIGAPEAHVPALHWAENAARSVQEEVLLAFYDALTEGLEEMKG